METNYILDKINYNIKNEMHAHLIQPDEVSKSKFTTIEW